VVHSLGLGPKALAAASSGLPWVVSVNGIQSNEARATGGLRNAIRGFVLRRVEQAGLDAARDVIVPNPLVRSLLGSRLKGQRVHLVENQVDEVFFDVDGEGDPATIVCIGRLLPLKSPETLIDAVRRLADRRHDVRVRFVGPPDDPAYLETLRQRAARLGLLDRVTFLGFVSDDELLREVAGAGILAHPSRVEVAPLAVMQGLAAGRAVVATRVGGTAHLVRDRRTGRLVPPADPDAMASALEAYLLDPPLARRLAEAGRADARERWLPARVLERTQAVYEAVREARPGFESAGSRRRNPIELRSLAAGTPEPDGDS
jgi:glycosyltransferase involved in cell wall biosynthesis